MGEHSASILVAGIAMEGAYAGFTRGKLNDLERESPGLGYTVAYHGGLHGEATVFIYSLGENHIPDGPMSELVMGQLDQATRDIISHSQSVGTIAELVGRYGTGSPNRGAEFLCAEFILSNVAGARRTFIYVTACANNFVKIRITLRTNDEMDSTARKFADAVATGLWRETTH